MRAVLTPSPVSVANSSTRLTGKLLVIVRIVVVALFALFVALFVLGVPTAFQNALVMSDTTRQQLLARGISPEFPAYYLIILDTVTMFAFSAIAAMLLWHQSDDWMVMVSALTLVATAILYTNPSNQAPVPYWLLAFAMAMGEILQVSFVYLFPIGRFVPRWMGWLIVPMFVWRPAIWALAYIPNYLAATHTVENYGTLRQDTLDTVLMLLLFIIGVGAQVWRYRRRVYNPIQRLQTQWVLWGLLIALVVTGSYIIIVNTLGLLQSGGADELLLRLGGRTIRQIALFMVPFSLAFSISRYRLWEIDLLLQRTLIYAPLTGILAGLFAALVTLMQSIAVAVSGQQSLVATVITTMIVVAAIEPVRSALQKIVRRKFKDPPKPHQQLEKFNARIQKRVSAVRTRQLLRRFADEAINAYAAQGGAALIVRDNELAPAYTRGTATPALVLMIKVHARDKPIGAIALGERANHRPYSTRDRALLQKTAAVVGLAIAQDVNS